MQDDVGHDSQLDIGEALRRLDYYSDGLRSRAVLVALLAALTVASAVCSVLGRTMEWYPGYRVLVVACGCSFGLFGMLALYRWDQVRRMGMVYYEEISDEVEWSHRTFRRPDREVVSRKRAELSIRIQLREFLVASSLPLAPASSTSAAIYAGVLVLSLFVMALQMPSVYGMHF